jgi:hypothetical protein
MQQSYHALRSRFLSKRHTISKMNEKRIGSLRESDESQSSFLCYLCTISIYWYNLLFGSNTSIIESEEWWHACSCQSFILVVRVQGWVGGRALECHVFWGIMPTGSCYGLLKTCKINYVVLPRFLTILRYQQELEVANFMERVPKDPK